MINLNLDDFSESYDPHNEPTLSPVSPGDLTVPVQAFFAPETSPMARDQSFGARQYEVRAQQARMAMLSAEAFEKSESLCIEAPTGVGKSFAYLVPGILLALKCKVPTLVCTETIALQEQLTEKDLPYLQRVMGCDFTFVIAKGRANYVCWKRLELMLHSPTLLPHNVTTDAVDRIAAWAEKTDDGSRSAYPGVLPNDATWNAINSDGMSCSYPRCPHKGRCFYWKARRAWSRADVIVGNHSMLFSDMACRVQMHQNIWNNDFLLPRPGALIIDEAHTIEDVAARQMGIHVFEPTLHVAVNRLFDAKSSRGMLMRYAGVEAMRLRDKVDRLHLDIHAFFDNLRKLYDGNESTVNEAYQESDLRLFSPLSESNLLSGPLNKVIDALTEFITTQRDQDADAEKNAVYYDEFVSQICRLKSFADDCDAFCAQNVEAPSVYWLSRSALKSLSLNSAPVRVAELFDDYLFAESLPPVLMTSATLTVRRSFDYFRSRTGFRGAALQLDSPFDFQKQLQLYLPKNMPAPNSEAYLDALIAAIEHYVSLSNGCAFVLFTSYVLMRSCYLRLKPYFESRKMTCMMQGEGLTRSQMLFNFKENVGSVIMGTSSFWTGVDVPGRALSNVIITKLPFPVPSEPIVAARSEAIVKAGGNAFYDYTLPEAVIKLRQGAGRVIRSRTDTGMLVILDNRVTERSYGNVILNSLPACPVIRT